MESPMEHPMEHVLTQPEGKQLEFKRDLSSPKSLLKALVAFANTAGGQLIIGRGDDGEIIGVDDPLATEERLTSLIADSIFPRLLPNIELFSVGEHTLPGKMHEKPLYDGLRSALPVGAYVII